jgi:hypothetical protein
VVWPGADATLVELRDPADPALATVLSRVDPVRDLVLVVAPAAPGDAAELTAFAVAGPGIDLGRARSATTRRDGYVTLPDVGVTVLDALGVTVPDAMNGTEITSGGGPGYGPTTASELADANTIAVFRNRTVGPVSVIFVSLQIVTYLVAVVLLVRGGRRRWGRAAVGFAGLVIVALPVVTFLFGLVRYDRLGLTGYTFAVVGAAVVLALLAVPARRLHRAAPLVCLIALNWLVQVVDLVTGGRLQIDTTFGYSPIVAGRFQGIGNLAFALLVGSALVAATAEWERGGGTPRLDRWWAMVAAIFAVTVVVDGWPAFGSDVGGVLACVPAGADLARRVAGERPPGDRHRRRHRRRAGRLRPRGPGPAGQSAHPSRAVRGRHLRRRGRGHRAPEAGGELAGAHIQRLRPPGAGAGGGVRRARHPAARARGRGPVAGAGAAALPDRRRGGRRPRVRRERLRGGDPRDDDRHGGALAHPPPVRGGARPVTVLAGGLVVRCASSSRRVRLVAGASLAAPPDDRGRDR